MPDPVGAEISVLSPRAIAGQPSSAAASARRRRARTTPVREARSERARRAYRSRLPSPRGPQHLPMIARPAPVTVMSEVLEKRRAARHSDAPASRLPGGRSVSMTVRVPLTRTASTSAYVHPLARPASCFRWRSRSHSTSTSRRDGFDSAARLGARLGRLRGGGSAALLRRAAAVLVPAASGKDQHHERDDDGAGRLRLQLVAGRNSHADHANIAAASAQVIGERHERATRRSARGSRSGSRPPCRRAGSRARAPATARAGCRPSRRRRPRTPAAGSRGSRRTSGGPTSARRSRRSRPATRTA